MPDTPPPGAPSAEALAGFRAKQIKRNRWAKLASTVVVLVLALRACIALLPSGPKACDEDDVQHSVLESLNAAYAKDGVTARLIALTGIQTVSSTDKANVCTARGILSDRHSGKVDYTVDRSEIRAHIAAAS